MRLSAETRRAMIIERGVEIANEHGLLSATGTRIAVGTDYTVHTVRRYFLNQAALWQAIAESPLANERVKKDAKTMRIPVAKTATVR